MQDGHLERHGGAVSTDLAEVLGLVNRSTVEEEER